VIEQMNIPTFALRAHASTTLGDIVMC